MVSTFVGLTINPIKSATIILTGTSLTGVHIFFVSARATHEYINWFVQKNVIRHKSSIFYILVFVLYTTRYVRSLSGRAALYIAPKTRLLQTQLARFIPLKITQSTREITMMTITY